MIEEHDVLPHEAVGRSLLVTGFTAGCLTSAGLLFVAFLIWAATSFSDGDKFDDPAEYADAQLAMYGVYGRYARHLPHTIPDSATNVGLKASTDDVLQAEPFIYLTYVLPVEEANAEIQRLRALEPKAESAGLPGHSFGFLDAAKARSGLDRSACVRFEFGDSAAMFFAEAVVDPVHGDVFYLINND